MLAKVFGVVRDKAKPNALLERGVSERNQGRSMALKVDAVGS